jgi:Flp pilus assembly protein TadD
MLALLATLAVAVLNWRRRPIISMGVGIFAVAIVPVSNLLFPIGTFMAERVLYLPSLGFCLLVAALVTTLAARPRWRLLAVGTFALVLIGYGARTVLRNRDWRSNATLFATAARASPNSTTAHAYFGNTLLVRGDLSGARKEYERSLEIYPGYSKALVGLGIVLERQGRIDEAVQVYRRVERGKRSYGRARLNVGFIALQRGRPNEALLEFRELAALGFLGAKEANELAEGFFKLGYITEAQTILEAARRFAPHVFYIRENLALVYWRQGRREDAQQELEAAARLKAPSP